MPDEVQQSRTQSWSDWFPNFTPLFRAFRMSYGMNQLGMAFAAVLLIVLWGLLLDAVWPEAHRAAVTRDNGNVVNTDLRVYVNSGLDAAETASYRGVVMGRAGPFGVMADFVRGVSNELTDAVFAGRFLTDIVGHPGIFRAFFKPWGALLWLVQYHPLYALLFVLGVLAILSIFGGAAHRLAALYATREDVAGPAEAMRFAKEKFLAFLCTPILPLGLILIGLLVLAAGGWLLGYGWLSFVAGLIWFLPLIGGLILAVLTVGALAGWPLWFPAIAVEGSDVFDAFSRSYSYVFQRPWRSGLFALISLIYGAICFVFVKLFAWLLFTLVHIGAGWGMNFWDATRPDGKAVSNKLDAVWHAPGAAFPFWGAFPTDQLGGASRATSYLIAFWSAIVILLVAAWVLSFFCSASTLSYLLLRRDVDGTDLEDIWVEEDDDMLDKPAEPEPSGAGSASSTSLPIVEQPGSPPSPDRPPGSA